MSTRGRRLALTLGLSSLILGPKAFTQQGPGVRGGRPVPSIEDYFNEDPIIATSQFAPAHIIEIPNLYENEVVFFCWRVRFEKGGTRGQCNVSSINTGVQLTFLPLLNEPSQGLFVEAGDVWDWTSTHLAIAQSAGDATWQLLVRSQGSNSTIPSEFALLRIVRGLFS